MVGFARTLRAAGAADPERVQAMLAALDHLDVLDPNDVYWAGRLTMCADPDDLARYDRCFAAYFSGATARPGRRPPPVVVRRVTMPDPARHRGRGGGRAEGGDRQRGGGAPRPRHRAAERRRARRGRPAHRGPGRERGAAPVAPVHARVGGTARPRADGPGDAAARRRDVPAAAPRAPHPSPPGRADRGRQRVDEPVRRRAAPVCARRRPLRRPRRGGVQRRDAPHPHHPRAAAPGPGRGAGGGVRGHPGLERRHPPRRAS